MSDTLDERDARANCEAPGRESDLHLVAVYEELRRRAREAMRFLPPAQTLQPTALVHEAYANLVTRGTPEWESEEHFLASATLAIRTAIVDRVRTRNRVKRGRGRHRVRFDEDIPLAMPTVPDETILGVDQLLSELRSVDERAADVVTYRFFMGMTEEQVAGLLGVSDRTVRRDWTFAKSWLMSRLNGGTEIE